MLNNHQSTNCFWIVSELRENKEIEIFQFCKYIDSVIFTTFNSAKLDYNVWQGINWKSYNTALFSI